MVVYMKNGSSQNNAMRRMEERKPSTLLCNLKIRKLGVHFATNLKTFY